MYVYIYMYIYIGCTYTIYTRKAVYTPHTEKMHVYETMSIQHSYAHTLEKNIHPPAGTKAEWIQSTKLRRQVTVRVRKATGNLLCLRYYYFTTTLLLLANLLLHLTTAVLLLYY